MELNLTVVDLSRQVLALQQPLAAAEAGVLQATGQLHDAKRDLADAEMTAWRTEAVEGKNAEQRSAHLRGLTYPQIVDVELAEQRLRVEQSTLRLTLEEIKTLRAILYALGGAGVV